MYVPNVHHPSSLPRPQGQLSLQIDPRFHSRRPQDQRQSYSINGFRSRSHRRYGQFGIHLRHLRHFSRWKAFRSLLLFMLLDLHRRDANLELSYGICCCLFVDFHAEVPIRPFSNGSLQALLRKSWRIFCNKADSCFIQRWFSSGHDRN